MNLPPLPDTPWMLWSEEPYEGIYRSTSDAYSEEQMREYAASAVAADRDAICRLVFGHCGSDNDAQRIVDAIRGMK